MRNYDANNNFFQNVATKLVKFFDSITHYITNTKCIRRLSKKILQIPFKECCALDAH
jgi:hypothetical protein